MGFHEAVDLGSRYVADYGYSDVQLRGAEQLYPNVWRVRYELAPKDSGKFIHLYFDGANKTLVRMEELKGIGGTLVPDHPLPSTTDKDNKDKK